MPLNFQTISLPLRAGLDTKSHPHAVEPPKLLTCTNAVFDEPGSLAKRPGTATLGLTTVAGGSITASRTRAMGVLGDELLLFAEGKCYSWSEKESAWIDRGRFESLLTEYKTRFGDGTDQVTPDRATVGNVTVVAWEDRTNSAVRWKCFDNVTGAPMVSSSTGYVASAVRPRCLALNGKLLVFFHDGTTTIKCDVIDPADVYGTLGASLQTITAEAAGPYDLDGYSSTECVLAYVVVTTLLATVKRIDSTGAVTTTGATGRVCEVAIAINYNATPDRFALVRLDDDVAAGNGDIFLDWLKADLTDDGANVNIAVATNQGEGNVHNLAVAVLTGQTAYAFWDQSDITINGVTVNGRQFARVFRSTVTTSAATERVLARRCCLGSRAIRWSDGSAERVMVHVYYSSDLQSQYVLLDAGYVAGDLNDNNANREEVGILARLFPGEGPSTTATRTVEPAAVLGGLARTGHLPQIESLGSNQYACALTYRRGEESTTTNYKKVYHERGIRDVTYTAFDSRAFTGNEEGGALYGPGGYVWMYNGQRVVENGFFLYPDFSSVNTTTWITRSAVGGTRLTVNSTYYYRWYYEVRHPSGERERSTYSGNITVVLGLTDDTVAFNLLPTLQFTSKWRGVTSTEGTSVRLVGYRSKAGDPSRFYRITSYDPAASNAAPINNPNVEHLTFTDTMDDTTLVLQEEDYISAGELDHTPARATPFLVTGQARCFTRDPEDPYLIYYSLQRLVGDAVAFHHAHTIRVPQAGGPVTSVVVTEGALYILSERAVYASTGQGPTNTASTGSYSSPQPLVVGVGCTEPRSVVRTTAGVFFKSSKGIYLLSYGGEVTYVGAGVEDHNSLGIVGAVDVPDKHRVEFTTDDSLHLVYDYLVGEWSAWESSDVWGNGKHAVLWGSSQVRLDSVGAWEPQATYADGSTGYALAATMRIRPAGILRWSRTRRVFVIGEYVSAHDLRVVLAYDDTTTTETFDWIASETAAASPYRFRASPGDGRQQASAIEVRITDRTPTGGAAWRAGMKLTGLALEVGLKPGGPRLPADQTE